MRHAPSLTPLFPELAPIWQLAAVVAAARHAFLPLLDEMLQDPRLDVSTIGSLCLLSACSREAPATSSVAERLLADPRVDVQAGYEAAVTYAAWAGHVSLLERLLPRVLSSVAPAADRRRHWTPLVAAATAASGHEAVVKLLLVDVFADRVTDCSPEEALRCTVQHGHAGALQMLLADTQVTPADGPMQVISWDLLSNAIIFGDAEPVAMLIASRATASARNLAVLRAVAREAAASGRALALETVLADPHMAAASEPVAGDWLGDAARSGHLL